MFDPGFSPHGFEGSPVSAILVTHQHPDHADPGALPALVEANPGRSLYADPATAAELGGGWRAVHAGDQFGDRRADGPRDGGRHAVIHPEIPVIDNISYVLGDDEHAGAADASGDALFVPDEAVDVLPPAAAPWMRISEAVDYLRAVAPTTPCPSTGASSPRRRGHLLRRLTEMTGTDFRVLPDESSISL